MSDCVYRAWVDHMAYLGFLKSDFFPLLSAWDLYICIRRGVGNENGYTYGGIVPVIFRAMSGMYGCSVKVQYRIWTPEMYIADIEGGGSGLDQKCKHVAAWLVRDMVSERIFGVEVDRITLAPAVYLLLNQSHAVFSESVPTGGPVMALQVYKE